MKAIVSAAALALALAFPALGAGDDGAAQTADCLAQMSRALTTAARPFTIVRSSQGVWQSYVGDLRVLRPAPFAEAVKRELATIKGSCPGNELYERLHKNPQNLLQELAAGTVILTNEGLRVQPPPPPPPAEEPAQPDARRAAGQPAANPTPVQPQPEKQPMAPERQPTGESLWSIGGWIVTVLIFVALLLSVCLIIYRVAQRTVGFFRDADNEFWQCLRNLSNFADTVKEDLADLKDMLHSLNVTMAEVVARGSSQSKAGDPPARNIALPPPHEPPPNLVLSCNRALAGESGAVAEFERWCDRRAYDRDPRAAMDLRFDPDVPFDRSYFWYVEAEGQRQGQRHGQIFPGFGIPLGYAGLMADDAGRLYKILEGVFRCEHGDNLSVVEPAKVVRISQDRLQIRKLGVMALPRR